MSPPILENVDVDEFKAVLGTLPREKMIIVRFTADWCKPCQTIDEVCQDYFGKCDDNIVPMIVDIVETVELYGTLKRYKMVNGIPVLLAFHGNRTDEVWYVPSDSHVGGDISVLKSFFKRCDDYVVSMKNPSS